MTIDLDPNADQQPTRWYACCDACHRCMDAATYVAAEAAAGREADPRCPGCDRSLWSFHRLDDDDQVEQLPGAVQSRHMVQP